MSFEQIRYDVADGAATITLNRPEALNALTVKMMSEMREAVLAATADDDVHSIVFTGEGYGWKTRVINAYPAKTSS